MDDLSAVRARLDACFAGTNENEPRNMLDLEFPKPAQALLNSRLKERLKPAAVLIPIVARPTGATVLLTERSAELNSHAGQVSFPGGRRDPEDESLKATALRESYEEVGMLPEWVQVIGYLDDYPTVTRYRITPVLAWVEPLADFTPEEGEVAEIFEVPLAHLLDPKNYSKKSITRMKIDFPYYEIDFPYYEIDWAPQRIWGATAGMLFHLMQTLNADSS